MDATVAPALLNWSGVSILGKLSFDRDETLARPVLDQMLAVLQPWAAPAAMHLGPGIALGWCGEAGALQTAPARVVTNEFQTVRAIADGALTNAGALRLRLERRGCRFRTRTDAEVMAHAYDAWGDRCVESFEGPFACAIWDDRRKRLLLARDHLGIRPLYFALLHGRGVVFASTIRALLQDPGVSRECCPEAIDAYLALGYVPSPLTAYRRVSKLEAAHRLVVDGRRLHVEQYWDLPRVATTSTAEAAEALEAGLAAIHARDAGDPVAVLYSGGTASTALLATAPAASERAVTVSLDGDFGDADDTRVRARHLGHEPVLAPAMLDTPLDMVLALATDLEEPIADPAAVVQYALCGAAGRWARVVRSGHGAAALWAGYARHRADRVDAIVRTWLGRLDPVPHLAAPLRASLRSVAASSTAPTSALWDDRLRQALYTPAFARQVRDANPFARHMELYAARDSADPVDRALYVDARTFLPDSALAMATRAAGAMGLEVHVPYLERHLVELAAATPPAAKGPDGGMRPLRALLARRLPLPLLPAPRRAAAHGWLHPALSALVPAVLLRDEFDGRGIVSPAQLRQVWSDYCASRRHTRRLWSLLVLELWFRQDLDGHAATEPVIGCAGARAA